MIRALFYRSQVVVYTHQDLNDRANLVECGLVMQLAEDVGLIRKSEMNYLNIEGLRRFMKGRGSKFWMVGVDVGEGDMYRGTVEKVVGLLDRNREKWRG